MYDLIPVFLGAIISILGLIMAILPKQSTKKEMRDDETAVAKVRRNGIVLIIIGIILIIINLI